MDFMFGANILWQRIDVCRRDAGLTLPGLTARHERGLVGGVSAAHPLPSGQGAHPAARPFAVICAAVITWAFAFPARADDCAALVGKIVQREGAAFKRLSPRGNIYFLKHRLVTEISVNCGADSVGPMVTVDLDKEPFPSEVIFLLTARLGSLLTGIKPSVLLKSLHSCHQEALKETRAEVAERELANGVQVECHAFTRDGGASSFTISTDISK